MTIQATTPTRISLFGGGTDVNPYAEEFGGFCVSFAINIRQNIVISEEGNQWLIPEGANKRFYEAFLDDYGVKDIGLSATFDGVIESGLGSSASAAVALVAALQKLRGYPYDRGFVANKAWDIEVNKLGLFGGKQDQYAASFGGANMFMFGERVTNFPLSRTGVENIIPNMLLVYTGFNRKSPDIQVGFKDLDKKQISALNKLKHYAMDSVKYINNGDWSAVGSMLDDAWEFKKKSNKGVSSLKINKIYKKAKSAGALGGKILGAGGGGHMLFVVEPERRKKVRDLLMSHDMIPVDFDVDWNGLGVKEI